MKLLKQNNYRSFLEELIRELSKEKTINFSALSRQAGFSSRSYIKEVIAGKKRLTLSSTAKVKQALGMNTLLGNYFEALVALEEEDVDVQQLSLDSRKVRAEKLRTKLLDRLQSEALANSQGDKIFLNRYAPDVYAALGTVEAGASLEEITQRCGLSEAEVLKVLQHFLELQVVDQKRRRYFAVQCNLDIFGQGNNLNFQTVYIQGLHKLNEEARRKFENPQSLFLHSAFSISKNKLPELRERLRKVVLEVLDEQQIDSGDHVAKVTLGLY